MNLELAKWSPSPTMHYHESPPWQRRVWTPERFWSIMRLTTRPGSLLHTAEYQYEANKTRTHILFWHYAKNGRFLKCMEKRGIPNWLVFLIKDFQKGIWFQPVQLLTTRLLQYFTGKQHRQDSPLRSWSTQECRDQVLQPISISN